MKLVTSFHPHLLGVHRRGFAGNLGEKLVFNLVANVLGELAAVIYRVMRRGEFCLVSTLRWWTIDWGRKETKNAKKIN